MRCVLGYIALLVIGVLVGSCSQTIQPERPNSTIASSLDFFWTRGELTTGLDYRIERNGTTSEHLISSNDGINIHDAALNATSLVVHSSIDSVLLDSVGASSIFSLPQGYFFASKNTSAPTPFSVRALLVRQNGRIIAATDSGIFYSDDEASWTKALSLRATVLAQDSGQNVYAGIDDKIYQSGNGGTTWTFVGTPHPGITISAIECLANGDFFVGYGSTFGVERFGAAQYMLAKLRTELMIDSVRAISAGMSRGREEVVVAESNWLWYVRNSKIVDSIRLYHGNSICVVDTMVYVGDESGRLYAGSFGDSLNFLKLPAPISSVILRPFIYPQHLIVATIGASVYEYVEGSTVKIDTGNINAASLQIRGEELLIGTPVGIRVIDLAAQRFVHYIGPRSNPDSVGGLLLLLRSKLTGGSWPAGVIRGPLLGSGVAITARVMDHPDKLWIDSTNGRVKRDYGEALQVRYAAELPDGSLSQAFPLYLLIYYVKGVGPVLIEEYLGNVLQERAQLIH